MKVSKKQSKFIELVEKCGFVFRHEIDFQTYPESLIDALISKGLLAEYKNKITSTTQGAIK